MSRINVAEEVVGVVVDTPVVAEAVEVEASAKPGAKRAGTDESKEASA